MVLLKERGQGSEALTPLMLISSRCSFVMAIGIGLIMGYVTAEKPQSEAVKREQNRRAVSRAGRSGAPTVRRLLHDTAVMRATTMSAVMALLLAAKEAAAQGPGNGISKSTWAASDPIHTSFPWLCAQLRLRRTAPLRLQGAALLRSASRVPHCSAPPF